MNTCWMVEWYSQQEKSWLPLGAGISKRRVGLDIIANLKTVDCRTKYRVRKWARVNQSAVKKGK